MLRAAAVQLTLRDQGQFYSKHNVASVLVRTSTIPMLCEYYD